MRTRTGTGIVAVLFLLGLMSVLRHAGKDQKMSQPPLTNEQKLKIAQEVLEGKRDPADLKKYGIKISDPVQIDPQTLLEQAEAERRGENGPVDKLMEGRKSSTTQPGD